jgi:hypothetical protein
MRKRNEDDGRGELTRFQKARTGDSSGGQLIIVDSRGQQAQAIAPTLVGLGGVAVVCAKRPASGRWCLVRMPKALTLWPDGAAYQRDYFVLLNAAASTSER